MTSGAGTVPAADWAFADCRHDPVSRHAGPDAHLPAGRLLRRARLRARLHREGSSRAGHRPRGDARHRVVLSPRARRDAARANPVAGSVTHAIAIGTSQSGNFIKTFVHLGFNEDLSAASSGTACSRTSRRGRRRSTSASPRRAALRTLYEPGSEPVLWWGRYADATRGRHGGEPSRSLHARRSTCPKVFEAFGAAEFWGLRMSPGLVGTDAVARHSAARQRASLLHAGHDARRRPRRFQLAPAGRRSLRACRQPESR